MPRKSRKAERTEIISEEKQKYFVGIYARLSNDRAEWKIESIETQIRYVEKYMEKAAMKEEFLLYDTYSDLGKTGTDFDRPEFIRMMKDVKAGKINCIMVKDFSRFGRNYIETGNYIEKIFPFMHVRFIAVSDGYDSLDASAKNKEIAMNLKNLVNDMYAKDISQKELMSKHLAQKQGDYVGSTAPYGYKVERIDGKHTLVVVPEEAEIVRLVFNLYVNSNTMTQIIRELFRQKIHSITDYRKYHHIYQQDGELLHEWAMSTLRAMLNRHNYYGDLVQRKYQSRFYKGGKYCELTSPDEWVVHENAHEPIISKELFEQAQKLLEIGRKKNAIQTMKKHPERILYNVLYCGDCGRKMIAYALVDSWDYYCRAAGYMDERKCIKKHINEKTIEKIVGDEIARQLQQAKLRKKEITALNQDFVQKTMQRYQKEEQQIIQQQRKQKAWLSEAFFSYKEGRLTKEAYLKRKEAKEVDECFYEDRLEQMKQNQRVMRKKAKKEQEFLQNLIKANVNRRLNAEIVESFIKRIDVYGDGHIEITFRVKAGE